MFPSSSPYSRMYCVNGLYSYYRVRFPNVICKVSRVVMKEGNLSPTSGLTKLGDEICFTQNIIGSY